MRIDCSNINERVSKLIVSVFLYCASIIFEVSCAPRFPIFSHFQVGKQLWIMLRLIGVRATKWTYANLLWRSTRKLDGHKSGFAVFGRLVCGEDFSQTTSC